MGSDFPNFPARCHGPVPLETRNSPSVHDLPRHHIACDHEISVPALGGRHPRYPPGEPLGDSE